MTDDEQRAALTQVRQYVSTGAYSVRNKGKVHECGNCGKTSVWCSYEDDRKQFLCIDCWAQIRIVIAKLAGDV